MTVAEQAALWVARLQSSDVTPADRAACADWCTADPAHQQAYAEFRDLWSRMAAIPAPPPRPRHAARAGAALLLCAALALGGPRLWLELRADAIAPTGQILHLTLPDGSLLDLDSGSAVRLDFDQGRRNVHVLRGAVFAEVRHDPAHPFIVTAGPISARALGTRYGTSAEAVTVTEGRVETRTPRGTVVLNAGESAVLGPEGLQAAPVDPDALAWRQGQMVVSGRPLAEVVQALARYHQGRVLLLNDAAAGRPVSGVFDVTDADHALDLLAGGLGLRLTRLPGLVVLR